MTRKPRRRASAVVAASPAAIEFDWEANLRELIQWMGNEAEVGSIVAKLLELFWPSSAPTVWDTIKDKVAALVDEKLLEYELKQHVTDLAGMRVSLQRFGEVPDEQRGGLLSAILVLMDRMAANLIESPNAIHVMPMVVAFSHLHLKMLHQQWRHGPHWYGPKKTDEARRIWAAQCVTQWEAYRDYFVTAYPGWLKWRMDQIELEPADLMDPSRSWGDIRARFIITDSVRGDKVQFNYPRKNPWDTAYFEGVYHAVMERVRNDAVREMVNTLSMTALLYRHLPPDDRYGRRGLFIPELANLSLGPYCPVTLDELSQAMYDDKTCRFPERLNPATPDIHDTPGAHDLLRMVSIWPGANIVGLRNWYQDDPGSKPRASVLGGDPGCDPAKDQHEYDGAAGQDRFRGMRLLFLPSSNTKAGDGILASVQMLRANGPPSEIYGNARKAAGHDIEANLSPMYRLVRCHYRAGPGPDGKTGIKVIKLDFAFVGD